MERSVIVTQGPGHERKTRSDKGYLRWTERDLAVLRWMEEQYVIGLDQLQVLLGRWSPTNLAEGRVSGAFDSHQSGHPLAAR